MAANNIPFFGKDRYFRAYSSEILELVNKVYSTGKVVMGPEVDQFEANIAKYSGRKYAVAVGSCTDALYFSLRYLNVGKGDEVLVTGFSFLASASCILMAGATPIFVDINPDTYMMSLKDLEAKITSKTKAIIAVHLFGDCLDIGAVEKIGKKHNIPLIEDSAQSIGCMFNDRKAGSMGLCSCISFDPTKLLSAQSNGGVLLTDDLSVYETISKMRYHGKNNKTGVFEILGFNSRISSLQAAILDFSLTKLESWIARNREIAGRYIAGLKDVNEVKLPVVQNETRHVYHKFVMKAENRDKLKKWLSDNKIDSMIHYKEALHENELFKKFSYRAGGLKQIDSVKGKVISLPIHPWLSNEEVDAIIKAVRQFYKQ